MIFKSESDVRQWVRNRVHNVFWIEPSAGSTFGLPDCVINDGGREHWFELKIGEIVNSSGDLILRFEVRPEQKRVLRTMARLGWRVNLLVGLKGASVVFVIGVDDRWTMDGLHLHRPEVPYETLELCKRGKSGSDWVPGSVPAPVSQNPPIYSSLFFSRVGL
jgi:hypothetical protein